MKRYPRLMIAAKRWPLAEGEELPLVGDELHYLCKVLRVTEGTLVHLFDGQGREGEAQLQGSTLLLGKIRTVLPRAPLWLFQGMLKHDKWEWVIQKATELGVTHLVPIQCQHSVTRLSETRAQERVLRWRQIAKQAAQQSGRLDVPEITGVFSWQEAWAQKPEGLHLVCHEKATQRLPHILPPHLSLGVWIGPEGGFSTDEVTWMEKEGAQLVSLGAEILRAETAAIAALSIVKYILSSR